MAAEALELLGFILCLLTRYEIVFPQLGAAFHLGKMCFYAGKIAVYIVIYFESFLSAVLSADAAAVRQSLGLDQIDK